MFVAKFRHVSTQKFSMFLVDFRIKMLLHKIISFIFGCMHHIIFPNLSSLKCSRIRITYCATCLKCWAVVWVKMCSWASLGVFPLAISPRIWTKLASLKQKFVPNYRQNFDISSWVTRVFNWQFNYFKGKLR